MVNKRLIPKLLLKEQKIGDRSRKVLVVTQQFSRCLVVGEPVSQARIYESQLADELILIDLDSQIETDPRGLEILKKVSEQIFLPLTVGGGVRTLEGFRQLIRHGADKVSLNTAALESPELITQAAETFGSQAVVISIDYRKDATGQRAVFSHSGRQPTPWEPLAWAERAQELGAGEVLFTDIERDGMRQGLDLEFLKQAATAMRIPVIFSGGCGRAQHFTDAYTQAEADAIAAGTFFCFKDENPMQARSRIKNAGVRIRMQT